MLDLGQCWEDCSVEDRYHADQQQFRHPVGERVDAECGIAEELADNEVVEVGNQGVNCVGTKQGQSETCHGPEHCG